jgi:ParB-like chromosome segregation protein Spo0J
MGSLAARGVAQSDRASFWQAVNENDQIIAGHGRVQAAKQLGLTEVPTVQIAHLSATQKRAYILADNRLAEKAGWDQEILAVELQGLLADGFEVVLTGLVFLNSRTQSRLAVAHRTEVEG